MKRLVLAVIAMVLLLSGCKIRIQLTTEINADESGTIAYVFAFDKEFRDTLKSFGEGFESSGGESSGSADPVDELEGQVPDGWKSERFKDGDLEGVRMSRDFKDLDDLRAAVAEADEVGKDDSSASAGTGTPTFGENFSVTREGDTFTLELGVESGTDPAASGAEGGEDFAEFGEALAQLKIEAIIEVTMPGKVLEHNADEKDGSELTWRFDQTSGSQTVRAVSDASQPTESGGGDFPVALVVGGGGAAALAVGLTLALRNRRSGLPPVPIGDVPGPGDAPPAPPPPAPPPPPPPPPG